MISLNFGWVIDHKLAGSRGPRSKEELMSLKTQGIGALVRLVESSESFVTKNDVNDAGLEEYNEPVQDFKAPTQEQIDKIIKYIDSHLERGIPVDVSCNAGIGRTGVILACYLVHKGSTVKDAIELLRKKRGRLPEVSEQIEAIKEYSLRINPGAK